MLRGCGRVLEYVMGRKIGMGEVEYEVYIEHELETVTARGRMLWITGIPYVFLLNLTFIFEYFHFILHITTEYKI